MLRWNSARCVVTFFQCRVYTTAGASSVNTKINENLEDVDNKKTPKVDEQLPEQSKKLIAAAFASLQDISRKTKFRKVSLTEEKLNSAEDVNTILSVAEQPIITRHQALMVVTKLTDWVRDGKCQSKDFDTDLRFGKVCRILGRVPHPDSVQTTDHTDLSIVLNVTADDQAAKLVNSMTLPQMVKILSSLGSRKRRSLSLLRSLSFNISKSSDRMNIKEAADVLYACANLNFVDEVLLEKTISDAVTCLKDNEGASVVKSIANSLGILRYRHTNLLEHICMWFIKNKELCSPKESLSILYTLATLNYSSDNSEKFMKISKELLTIDNVNTDEWVHVVWSLIVLNECDDKLLDSVLNPDFLQKLNIQSGIRDIALKLKLLNINGYAKLQGNKYQGHLLDETSPICEIPLSRSKEEQMFFDSFLETISSIVVVSDYVKTDVDSKMGFLIDAELYMDDKKNFVKLSEIPAENVSKVAVMICNYHDMCRGCSNEPTGITALIHRMIRNNGYKLLLIPYYEFHPKDKLTNRVQYLSQKLENLDD